MQPNPPIPKPFPSLSLSKIFSSTNSSLSSSLYLHACLYYLKFSDLLSIGEGSRRCGGGGGGRGEETMTRRCSHCSNNGHNSRTCSSRGGGGGGGGCVKLFGVKLTDDSIIKKSASMGNLSAHYHSPSSAAASPNSLSPSPSLNLLDGYLSDDPAHASRSPNRPADRKKGIPWTEEEHRMFLVGLQKLGKGDWRGISRNFVVSRTPTQVASHAQKYYIRQTTSTRRKRRSSLFDMVSDKATDQPPVKEEQQYMLSPSEVVQADKLNSHHQHPSLDLTLKTDFGSMEATPYKNVEETKEIAPLVIHSFVPAYLPLSLPLWPSNAACSVGEEKSCHRVVKPIPVFAKERVNVNELVGMSKLNIGGTETGHMDPSPLSQRLLKEPSRQSAFHASTPHSMVQI